MDDKLLDLRSHGIGDTGSLSFMDEYVKRLGGIQGEKFKGLAESHPAGLVRGLCNMLIRMDAEMTALRESGEDAARSLLRPAVVAVAPDNPGPVMPNKPRGGA